MQITIVQAEIEEAIRNYIQRVINVREGMNISIELSATRGADGFKAAIDIVPTQNTVSLRTMPADIGPAASVVTPFPPFSTPRSETKALVEVNQDPVSTGLVSSFTVPETTSESAEEPSTTEASSEQAEAVQTAEAPALANTDTAPEANQARSLFKGLRRPVNA